MFSPIIAATLLDCNVSSQQDPPSGTPGVHMYVHEFLSPSGPQVHTGSHTAFVLATILML